MDGVLTDFMTSALEKLNKATGKNITPEEYVSYNTFEMEKVFKISIGRFWDIIDNNDFWINLKPFPWAKELVKFLQHEADVTISTSPSNNPACFMQKVEWAHQWLGLSSNYLMLGSRKYLMAHPNNILIDDYQRNINKFRENGGKAILIPSNWNTLNLNYETIYTTIVTAFEKINIDRRSGFGYIPTT